MLGAQEPFSNEYNTCVAHVDETGQRPLAAFTGSLRAEGLLAVDRDPKIAAALAIAAGEGLDPGALALREARVVAARGGGITLTAVHLALEARGGCIDAICADAPMCDAPLATAVVFFEGERAIGRFMGRRADASTLVLANVFTLGDAPPLALVLHDMCDCWSFSLIGRSPDGWRIIANRASGPTV